MFQVLEMIFRCTSCNQPRQYGTALNYLDKPDNLAPVLQCSSCRHATYYRFDKIAPRTESRERKLSSEMKVMMNGRTF